jgi:hypothetical protein
LADKDCRRQGERLHDFGHIRAVTLDGAFSRRARACAVPTHSDRHVTRSNMRHLRVPVAVSAAKSVDENAWRTALAGDDVVDERHDQALVGCLIVSLAPPLSLSIRRIYATWRRQRIAGAIAPQPSWTALTGS